MTRSIEELFPEKPEKRLRVYAWSTIDLPKYDGCLKIGQTTRDVNTRIKESQGQATYDYTLEVDEPAERNDGSTFSDHAVRARLAEKGFESVGGEWVRCAKDDVLTAISEMRSGQRLTGTHHLDFPMRAEQADAVEKTASYFDSIWAEKGRTVPRFLWNAKMRFGKTFSAFQLAKRVGAQRVLVVTFKPAVEDSWRADLEDHVAFDGWQYLSIATGASVADADPDQPIVYFGSFQDLMGRDKSGNIKAKNEWLHTTHWDLVILDEYHFGAWRDRAKELFEGEDETQAKKELDIEYNAALDTVDEQISELGHHEAEFLPITTDAYLYLSGTPFRALASGEFIEEQIFNWTYTDEQRAKQQFADQHPDEPNPYAALPEMRLLTYQMPDELLAVASGGEFDEFDLNEFFHAEGTGPDATFRYKDDVQKWLNIIRGEHLPTQLDSMKMGERPPFPYSDVRLLPYLNHAFWFLPSVAACHAMRNLMLEKQNNFWHDYKILVVAGSGAGIGLDALPPVRRAIGAGHDTKTITLSCGKLTTGVTVPQWGSMLMLRNLTSPETYFQAAFRVQSPWSIKNPEGTGPRAEEVLKPACFVFDFAPTRALRQLADYGTGLAPDEPNPERAVEDLVNFLPVLAYNGSHMTQVDAGSVLDIAMSGTSATLLARKWESAILVNVDNNMLRKLMADDEAMEAVMNIEGFRALGSDIFDTVVNKSEAIDKVKKDKGQDLSKEEKKELTSEEKEFKSKRKQIQENLVKFATRIPAFMYLTDYRENTLQDVVSKLEPGLFRSVTGLTVAEFNRLVSLGLFNASHMNQAVFAFRRYEDASLNYTGIESHPGLRRIGLYDTVIAAEEEC